MPIKTALACRGEQCSPAYPQQRKNNKADARKSSAFFSVIDNKPDMYYNIGIVKMNGGAVRWLIKTDNKTTQTIISLRTTMNRNISDSLTSSTA